MASITERHAALLNNISEALTQANLWSFITGTAIDFDDVSRPLATYRYFDAEGVYVRFDWNREPGPLELRRLQTVLDKLDPTPDAAEFRPVTVEELKKLTDVRLNAAILEAVASTLTRDPYAAKRAGLRP